MRIVRYSSRRGAVLILMLWMIIILGVIGLAYSASVRTQLSVERVTRGRTAAYWAARAGVERAMAALAELGSTPETLGEKDKLFDDEESFKDQEVGSARYSLVRPKADKAEKTRYGLSDEAGRLNINTADEQTLMALEGMTQEMAESLIDWRDEDPMPLAQGAEADYYQGLSEPYLPKNAAFSSVRELLNVRGWGEVFAAGEPDPYRLFNASKAPASQIEPEEARLLLHCLTAWSLDPDLAPDGQKKLNLQNVSGRAIRQRLSGVTALEARSIARHRREKRYQAATDLLDVMEAPQNTSRRRTARNRQGQQQNGAGQGDGQDDEQGAGQEGMAAVAASAPQKKAFTLQRVGEIIDNFTANENSNDQGVAGLININTAPREVLLTLPAMSENLADSIIQARQSEPFARPGAIASRLSQIDENTFRQLYPRITTSSRRFRVISRGSEPEGQATVTIEAVLAVEDTRVSIIDWRER